MKKKLLFFALAFSALVCVLAFTVSAAEWFGDVEIIDNNGDGVSDISVTDTVPNAITEGELTSESALVKLSCDCQAGSHTFPAYYICTINRNVRYRCYNLDYGKLNALKSEYCGGTATYTLSNVIAFELPAGYTDADPTMVKNAPSLKYFSFAKCSTATRVVDAYGGHNWLQGTPVEEINIGSFLTKIPNYFCYNCDSLTSLTVPDQVVEIGTLAFYGCDNLATVKFSKNSQLTTFGAQSFKSCKSIGAFYIPSGVTAFGISGSGASPIDGCSSLYFVSDPDDTAKPSVYYFPTTVTSIVGEAFKNCTSLNDVLVFHEGITSVSDGWAFCGSNAISVVFLGNMVDVSTSGNAWNSKITLYFCNENDKSASDLSMKTGATKVFCFGEGNTSHIKELSLETEANCEAPKMVANYCFCGTIMGEPVTEGTALGHKNTIFVDLVYTNYLENGYYSYKCERCGTLNDDTIAQALFTCLGYSAPETGKLAISLGFKVNNEAIAEYKELTGVDVKYGVFAASSDKLGSGDVFENGTANANAICAEINTTEFAVFDLKITGFADAQKNALLALGAYVSVTKDGATEYSYMQDSTKGEKIGNYFFASFNDIIK